MWAILREILWMITYEQEDDQVSLENKIVTLAETIGDDVRGLNGVSKEVTEALGQVQVQGSASWAADGAPYPINAQVYHNGKQWLALRANSVAPAEGEDWTELVGKKYIDDSIPDLAGYLQPSITGSCTTNGTTDNTLVLTGIVPALALEVGDVIQITGSTGGLNDKLHTVESITDDNSIVVNYEHAGNRGNGSLRLVNQISVNVTIKRIAKWYNAPTGLGQAWVDVTASRKSNTTYTNSTGRPIMIAVTQMNAVGGDGVFEALIVDGVIIDTINGKDATTRGSATAIVPAGGTYRITGAGKIITCGELR